MNAALSVRGRHHIRAISAGFTVALAASLALSVVYDSISSCRATPAARDGRCPNLERSHV